MSAPTADDMEAACAAALAIDRAKLDIMPDEFADTMFALGFAAGAQWCVDTVKVMAKQP